MKCEKCGFKPNPGDQICMNCGAKLSVKNAIMPGLETIEEESKEKKHNYKMGLIIGISIIIIILTIIIIWRVII